MPSERGARWAMVTILGAFLVLGFAYSVINPLHEATDELRHYRFVQHIVQRGALPVQGEGGCSAQGHHPPLYYALAAAMTGWIDTGRDVCYEPPENPFWAHHYWEVGRDNKNQYLHGADEGFPWSAEALAAHLARLLNVAIGAAVVLATYATGRAIWPARPYLALGGAAIVAFNPMFLYMASAINNDVIAALSGALITLASVRLLCDEEGLRPRWGLVFGALYGLALLSKFNLAAILVTIELALIWVAWRRRQWRHWLVVNLLMVLVAALIAGWWFVRNQMLYGEPTGVQRLTELWGVRDPSESFGVALFELPYVWTSLWGRFGYGQIPLPQILYDLLWWAALFAALGTLLPFVLRQKEEIRQYGIYLALLGLNVVLFAAVIFNYLLVSPAGPMGRFFFPALPSLALLLMYGISRWLALKKGGRDADPRSERRQVTLAGLVSLAMLGLALVALFGYLAPAYARPPAFAASAVIPNQRDVQFDGFVKLRGYELSATDLQPGETLVVRLYYEVVATPPGNYLQFLHLIDEAGMMVAQRDTHPGLGNFSSSMWQPGDRFIETIAMEIPPTTYTPDKAALSIGFYAPAEGYRLAVNSAAGELLGDALVLESIDLSTAAVPGAESDIPNPQAQNFSDEIMLSGYEYSGRHLSPGDPLRVTLYWRALRGGLPDYHVQLRLIDESGQIVKTLEARPQEGARPTGTWQRDELIADTHVLATDPALPPGIYHLQVALKDVPQNHRLNIVGADGHWIDEKLRLADIRIGS